MLDLSKNDPVIDLHQRVETYKVENSPYTLTTEGILCVSGIICRNKPLISYIQNHTSDQDLFDTPLIRMMTGLLPDICNSIEGTYIGYTCQNKFIMFAKISEDLTRDNVVSLVSSRIVNFLGRYYSNPMTLVSAYQVPENEVKNFLAYYKMNWVAKRNRILGSHFLNIPVTDVTLSHKEILSMCKNKGFDMLDLSPTIRSGFAYSPYE